MHTQLWVHLWVERIYDMKLTTNRIAKLPLFKSVCDGRGLYLRLSSPGSGSWTFKYMKDGTKHELGLGSYPLVSLSMARQKRDVLKGQLALGEDPFTLRKQTAEKRRIEDKYRFSLVAERVIQSKRNEWTCPKQEKLWRNSLQTYVYPVLDKKPLAAITRDDIIQILEPIWDNKTETAKKIMGRIGKIFGYAIVQGWYKGDNPAVWLNNLEMVFRPNHTIKHHPSLDYALLPDFYRKLLLINTLSSLALQFTILTVARTKETLLATRSEYDSSKQVWRIPANRMKARKAHKVPLSQQAIKILEVILRTHNKEIIFLGRYNQRAMSLDTMRLLIRRNFPELQATVHGFRSSFRNWAEENTNYSTNVIEFCLAHQLNSRVEGAYLRSELFERRRELMQKWADYVTSNVN